MAKNYLFGRFIFVETRIGPFPLLQSSLSVFQYINFARKNPKQRLASVKYEKKKIIIMDDREERDGLVC